MKSKLILGTGIVCLSMLYCLNSFAGCGRCAPQPTPCGPPCLYDTPCQCTDPNYRSNPCLEPCMYCEAFGNIGYR